MNIMTALTIEPEHELHFVGPFNRPVVTIMSLKNNSVLTLVFKIKTTAPRRYCVRPNIGKIAPLGSTQVEICLQPFIYDQNEKNKHKFMVQSVLAPQDADLTDLNKLWKELEPEQLQDHKLKCVFEMPPSSDSNADANLMSGISSVGGSGISSANNDDLKNDVPLISNEEKLSNVPDTVDHTESLLNEIKELKENNNELRKENLHMKDQIIRLRCSQPNKQVNELYAPTVLAENQMPIFYIAIAIAAAIFGLFLGKFLL